MDTRARVQRSALLLDECTPGWAAKVDVARLDLSSCLRCVLGQVYGDYSVGVRALGLWGQRPWDYVFTAVPGGEAAWAAEIARRTQPAPAPAPERELVAV